MVRSADALFYNGKVLVTGGRRRTAESIAVEDGRIVAIGSCSQTRLEAPRGCARHDLNGRPVIPGFIDSHTHFMQMGLDRYSADLAGAQSLKEALRRLASVARATLDGEWVIGTNWIEEAWPEARVITKSDLDRCCPRNPVVAYRVCLHMCSVNSRAMWLAGIDESTPGAIRTPSGKLTGVLKESALGVVHAAIPTSEKNLTRALMSATEKAHSVGVTSIHDNGDVGAIYNGEIRNLKTYRDAERAGKLQVRIRFNMPSSRLDDLTMMRLTETGSQWLSLGGLKVFCDGAIGARTAALSEPYADDPRNNGGFVHDPDDFDDIVAGANEGNIQLAIHAIGDIGIEAAISAIEKALDSCPRTDHRHRIEHLGLPTPGHLIRMQRLGIVASMQPNFVVPYSGSPGVYQTRLGVERAKRDYPLAEVLKARIRLAFGSDCMPMSPLLGIMCAVNAAQPSQRISVGDAISAYSTGAAFAGFEEDIKGTISLGKLADFVVLSNDPFVMPKRVASTQILQTVVGGRIVYDADKSSSQSE